MYQKFITLSSLSSCSDHPSAVGASVPCYDAKTGEAILPCGFHSFQFPGLPCYSKVGVLTAPHNGGAACATSSFVASVPCVDVPMTRAMLEQVPLKNALNPCASSPIVATVPCSDWSTHNVVAQGTTVWTPTPCLGGYDCIFQLSARNEPTHSMDYPSVIIIAAFFLLIGFGVGISRTCLRVARSFVGKS